MISNTKLQSTDVKIKLSWALSNLLKKQPEFMQSIRDDLNSNLFEKIDALQVGDDILPTLADGTPQQVLDGFKHLYDRGSFDEMDENK